MAIIQITTLPRQRPRTDVISDVTTFSTKRKYLFILSFLQLPIFLLYFNVGGQVRAWFPLMVNTGNVTIQPSIKAQHPINNRHPVTEHLDISLPTTERFPGTVNTGNAIVQPSIKTQHPINSIKAEQPIHHSHPGVEQDLEIAFPDSKMGDKSPKARISVAVGLGITSRIKSGFTKQSADMVFFQTLMPSFCMTASVGFSYRFYLAYDFDDPFFAKRDNLVSFNAIFEKFRMQECARLTFMSLHFVKCSHAKHPAWAQNDAMMMAYMDGNDYYYRMNDDTKMATNGWTEKFIKKLSEYDPPNIGVVGPTHSGGNTAILTYDFVHSSHIDVFGVYYPREYIDWYADNWITEVYKPGRITKLRDVRLLHTLSKGTRYKYHMVKEHGTVIRREKQKLERYGDKQHTV